VVDERRPGGSGRVGSERGQAEAGVSESRCGGWAASVGRWAYGSGAVAVGVQVVAAQI
jgi:hypothetical protein